jgi:hypothetical protein
MQRKLEDTSNTRSTDESDTIKRSTAAFACLTEVNNERFQSCIKEKLNHPKSPMEPFLKEPTLEQKKDTSCGVPDDRNPGHTRHGVWQVDPFTGETYLNCPL